MIKIIIYHQYMPFTENILGKKLISYAEGLIIKNNLKKIIINIQTNNQIAKKFYEKNGFIVAKGSKSGKIKMLKNLEKLL